MPDARSRHTQSEELRQSILMRKSGNFSIFGFAFRRRNGWFNGKESWQHSLNRRRLVP
jgi:hypothetical protein